jgi:CheY-like chemotaxis protein
MFSLTAAEAAQLWPELERLSFDRMHACGTRAAALPRRLSERATILVVDDDADVLDYTAEVLQDLGYRVVGAARPSEALHRLGDVPRIDLLVTDLVLPEVDGLKLAELAKRRHPALRVLYTSGYPAAFDRLHTARYGGFLAKPYRSVQLEAAVGAAIARM